MADHNLPNTGLSYDDLIAAIDARFEDLLVMLDPAYAAPTNQPVGTKRTNPSADFAIEQWNGTIWVEVFRAFELYTTSYTGDCNELTVGAHAVGSTATNLPTANTYVIYVAGVSSQITQLAVRASNGDLYKRVYSSAVWSGWTRAIDSGMLGTGVLAFLGTPSSANLLAALTSKTGTGNNVFSDTPTTTNHTVTASSGDALTITNTGTGNCLVVNDVAGDTTPTVIDTAGRIINGHTTSIAGAGAVQRNVQNIGSSVVSGITNAVFNSTTTANSQVEFAKSASNTFGAHTVVADGDALGEVRWSGSDGTNFIRAASITAQVDGTPGTSSMPGRLIFGTTADGGTAPTEALRIDSSQRTLMKAAHAVATLFANPSSGATVTLTNATSHYQKIGAAPIAELTINLPENPANGQPASVGSRAAITTLTVGSAGTATVVGAPTTLAASGYYEMIYEASTGIWYRKG